ncbi:MAG: N-acetyltransferase [Sphingomonas adhaesiva]|uniref:GNAT family N-acetyltransferase n=1 Tax=Sphingomonas adhaesiva TaxID=28212 RepID=UPI002FF44E80
MAIAIRPAGAPDVAAIDALLRASFPAPDEADLVRRLCVDGDMVLMLVAIDEDAGALAGAIAFSRMQVVVNEQAVPAVALAPLAVAPAWRRQGVAEALVQAGLEALETAGVVLCFVLGEPDYYARFGFHADYARNFASPYAGDYFMALPLQGGLMPCGVRGAADHAGAFAALG